MADLQQRRRQLAEVQQLDDDLAKKRHLKNPFAKNFTNFAGSKFIHSTADGTLRERLNVAALQVKVRTTLVHAQSQALLTESKTALTALGDKATVAGKVKRPTKEQRQDRANCPLADCSRRWHAEANACAKRISGGSALPDISALCPSDSSVEGIAVAASTDNQPCASTKSNPQAAISLSNLFDGYSSWRLQPQSTFSFVDSLNLPRLVAEVARAQAGRPSEQIPTTSSILIPADLLPTADIFQGTGRVDSEIAMQLALARADHDALDLDDDVMAAQQTVPHNMLLDEQLTSTAPAAMMTVPSDDDMVVGDQDDSDFEPYTAAPPFKPKLPPLPTISRAKASEQPAKVKAGAKAVPKLSASKPKPSLVFTDTTAGSSSNLLASPGTARPATSRTLSAKDIFDLDNPPPLPTVENKKSARSKPIKPACVSDPSELLLPLPPRQSTQLPAASEDMSFSFNINNISFPLTQPLEGLAVFDLLLNQQPDANMKFSSYIKTWVEKVAACEEDLDHDEAAGDCMPEASHSVFPTDAAGIAGAATAAAAGASLCTNRGDRIAEKVGVWRRLFQHQEHKKRGGGALLDRFSASLSTRCRSMLSATADKQQRWDEVVQSMAKNVPVPALTADVFGEAAETTETTRLSACLFSSMLLTMSEHNRQDNATSQWQLVADPVSGALTLTSEV